MATYPNVTIDRVFASRNSQNCWASLPGRGWVKVDATSVDGTTNVHAALTASRVNDTTATVITNAADDRIIQVYL